METMTLMTVLLFSCSLAVGQSTGVQFTEKAFVGNSVLLPCPYPGMPKDLVWQIGEKVVNFYPQTANDKNSIDESYINRTQLFLHMEKSNCSLLLHNVSVMDSGLYTCYVLTHVVESVTSHKSFKVNLTVSENIQSGPQDIQKGGENKDFTSVHIGIPILAVVLILAAGLLLLQMLRRRRQKKNIVYVPGIVQVNEV